MKYVWRSTNDHRFCSGIFDVPQCRSLSARVRIVLTCLIVISSHSNSTATFVSLYFLGSAKSSVACCMLSSKKFKKIFVLHFTARYLLFSYFSHFEAI